MANWQQERIDQILGRIPQEWPQEISFDKGWYSLVIKLDDELQQIDPDYSIQQIKEKFGGLRFYAEPTIDSVTKRNLFFALIDNAEEESYKICEICGKAARCYQEKATGWIRTLCEDDAGDEWVPCESVKEIQEKMLDRLFGNEH